jgi:hypothetical protein
MMKIPSRKRLAAGIGLLTVLALPAAAQPEAAPDYANATLSGDWGGARSAAWRSGWAWDAALKAALHSIAASSPAAGH